MDNFPDYCLRGIFTNDDVTAEGTVSATAYFPKPANNRTDGKSETSIDWEDDNAAFHACMNRYPRGVARLPRHDIDELNKTPGVQGILGYERAPLENNDKHGNILFPADFVTRSRTYRFTVAGAIAVRATWVKHQEEAASK